MSYNSFLMSPEYDLNTGAFGKHLLIEHDLTKLLYKSAMSHIYILKNKKNNKKYSLKAVKNQKDVFFNLSSLKMLDHPNLPKIIDIHETELYIYILKEYISGMNLKKYVEENHPLSKEKIKDILNQILTIFDYFHGQVDAIIYKDLKPENIIITPDEKIYLINPITLRRNQVTKDKDTFYIGTKRYASPEQFGFSQSSPKTDIYTIGTTLYYLLTKENPNFKKISKDSINNNQWITGKYEEIILKSTAFDPNNRFNTIDDLRKKLNERPKTNSSKKIAIGIVITIIAIAILLLMTQNDSGSIKANTERQLIFGPDVYALFSSSENTVHMNPDLNKNNFDSLALLASSNLLTMNFLEYNLENTYKKLPFQINGTSFSSTNNIN